jgi:hypothetical protein
MKKTRLLLALLALATGAFAQDTSAAKLALAREAIAALKADKMIDGMTAQMKQMSNQMVAGGLPADATPAQRALAEEFQTKVLNLSMESAKTMISQMDQVYAEVFTDAELKAMTAFFKSPEGESMMAKQPQVMQRVMPLAQSMQRELMPKMQALAEELKAKMAAAKAAETPPPAAK